MKNPGYAGVTIIEVRKLAAVQENRAAIRVMYEEIKNFFLPAKRQKNRRSTERRKRREENEKDI